MLLWLNTVLLFTDIINLVSSNLAVAVVDMIVW